MGEQSPTEKALVEALEDAIRENRTRALRVVVETLRSEGIRCLLVGLGAGFLPQVWATLTVDDVSAETIKIVVAALLRRAELSEELVETFAATAGSFATRWLARQRERAGVARPRPAKDKAESPPGDSGVRWTPRGPKFGGGR